MSDLSHMTTDELKREKRNLDEEEVRVRGNIRTINSITKLHQALILNTGAAAGLFVIGLPLTIASAISCYLLSESFEHLSSWLIVMCVSITIHWFISRKAKSIERESDRTVINTDNSEFTQLKKCEKTLTILLKRSRLIFAAGCLNVILSLIISFYPIMVT